MGRVLAAIFNILGARVEGAVFLDLYAGTGAVGVEAMSRAASMVYMVDADAVRIRELQALLGDCGCRGRAQVAGMRAEQFLSRAKRDALVFDIVFLDPPYEAGELARVLPVLGEGTLLAEGATVLAEHERRTELAETFGALRKVKAYRYGDTMLSMYRKEAS